jgi:hypothetical protein
MEETEKAPSSYQTERVRFQNKINYVNIIAGL